MLDLLITEYFTAQYLCFYSSKRSEHLVHHCMSDTAEQMQFSEVEDLNTHHASCYTIWFIFIKGFLPGIDETDRSSFWANAPQQWMVSSRPCSHSRGRKVVQNEKEPIRVSLHYEDMSWWWISRRFKARTCLCVRRPRTNVWPVLSDYIKSNQELCSCKPPWLRWSENDDDH